jgi:hypothetical protein
MLWRRLKLDWQYAIGELIIVTAGVLVALWIQQWNDDRLERNEEDSILRHLLIDLDVDAIRLDDMFAAVTEKEESLNRLKVLFDSGARPTDSRRFLEDIVVGSNYGWNQAEPRGSTYQEILSSGKFGLIRSPSLRSAIADYHSLFRSLYVRADARETPFPHISYQLTPRSHESDRKGVLLSPDSSISNADVERLVDDALSSDLRRYVIAEINLARFILRMTRDVNEQHRFLRDAIEAHLATLNE